MGWAVKVNTVGCWRVRGGHTSKLFDPDMSIAHRDFRKGVRAPGQSSGPDFQQPACPSPLYLVFFSLKSWSDSPLPCTHDVSVCLNLYSWQKLRHKMDLEADETSLGISWAAGSFIRGVGWTLMWGWKLSPPPVGTRKAWG